MEKRDIVGPEYILLVKNCLKASTEKVKQPNWNKNFNGLRCLEWQFQGEFLLSLCR